MESPPSQAMLRRCLWAVFIIDRRQTVRFFWATKNHASEPDYDLLQEM